VLRLLLGMHLGRLQLGIADWTEDSHSILVPIELAEHLKELFEDSHGRGGFLRKVVDYIDDKDVESIRP